MNNLVSIIIPIYNVEAYLRKCLDSVLKQTYTNIEIILIDDGSLDNSPSICDEYAEKDNRVNVIHKKNGGLSDSRNVGLKTSNGEWITFIDSDDWVTENYISTFMDIIEKEGNYDFIAANHFKYHNGKKIASCFSNNKKITKRKNITNEYCKLGIIPICAWNKLYNVVFLKKNNLSFTKNLLFEDQLWGLQCASKAEDIRLIPHALYFYNIRSESIMNSSSIKIEHRINSWSTIIRESIKILDTSDIPSQNKYLFLLHKIEEALLTSICNFRTFKKAYTTIQKEICKKPIYYWYKTAHITKKSFFLLLYIFPSTIAQVLLYHHLKQRGKND